MFGNLFRRIPSQVFLSSSEFVSSAHPDRLADDIAAIVINDIQKKDGPCSHAAIEVFLTHNSATFSGEALTSINLDKKYLSKVLSLGFKRAGYIKEMRKFWTKDEVLLPSNLKIYNEIAAQSPDIALGTTDKGEESGWNDQGVFFSSADNTNEQMIGAPHYAAQMIGELLQKLSRESILSAGEKTDGIILGPDNKSVVTYRVKEDGFTPIEISAITIAVAHASCSDIEEVREFVKGEVTLKFLREGIAIAEDCKWTINGTGRFVVHGPISDTSMTGRKISVNHPSAGPLWSNKMIGGGSLVKPAHASDLILNITARFIANVIVRSGISAYAVVGCSGAIGVQGLQSLFIKGDDQFEKDFDLKNKVIEFFNTEIKWAPIAIAKSFGFFEDGFDFGKAVDDNFFGHPETQPWENTAYIDPMVTKLKSRIR
jgi:S-adenosylmethionine synthetase